MDVIDLTDLQRRGLLKSPNNSKMPNSDFLDLTPNTTSKNPYATPPKIPSSVNPPHQESLSPLAFLDDFAKMASPSKETNPTQAISATTSINPLDLQDLNVKIENFEYKLENFIDKITTIENKIKSFENKLL